MWGYLTLHDAPRPWHRRAMVGRDGLVMGGSRWCQPLRGGAWHWWLVAWLLVDGLCGLCTKQVWAAMMINNLMRCARYGLVGVGQVHELMLIGKTDWVDGLCGLCGLVRDGLGMSQASLDVD